MQAVLLWPRYSSFIQSLYSAPSLLTIEYAGACFMADKIPGNDDFRQSLEAVPRWCENPERPANGKIGCLG